MACSHLWRETGNTRGSGDDKEIELECVKCNVTKWEKSSSF